MLAPRGPGARTGACAGARPCAPAYCHALPGTVPCLDPRIQRPISPFFPPRCLTGLQSAAYPARRRDGARAHYPPRPKKGILLLEGFAPPRPHSLPLGMPRYVPRRPRLLPWLDCRRYPHTYCLEFG